MSDVEKAQKFGKLGMVASTQTLSWVRRWWLRTSDEKKVKFRLYRTHDTHEVETRKDLLAWGSNGCCLLPCRYIQSGGDGGVD